MLVGGEVDMTRVIRWLVTALLAGASLILAATLAYVLYVAHLWKASQRQVT